MTKYLTPLYLPRFHAITPVTFCHDRTCMFCGEVIQGSSRHYHVAHVGPMCVGCIERTIIHFKGNDNYIRLTQLHPPYAMT